MAPDSKRLGGVAAEDVLYCIAHYHHSYICTDSSSQQVDGNSNDLTDKLDADCSSIGSARQTAGLQRKPRTMSFSFC